MFGFLKFSRPVASPAKAPDKRPGSRHEKTLLAILESMTEGVVVIDPAQKILLVNSTLARSLGQPKEKAEGRYFWEIFRDANLNSMIHNALKDRQPLKKEHSILLSDAVFEIRISPVTDAGEFVGVVAVFYDITQLKVLEESRTEFVANVSHELKTPLTSIMGFVETLKEGAVEDPENRMKFLGIIESHAKKLHRLIEDLLYLSRVESGGRELSTERFKLDDVVDAAVDALEKPIRSRKLAVKKELSPAPFWVEADAEAVAEALNVLLDNAVKYNEDGGTLEIRARIEDGSPVIQVRDTGIGIPEADLPRIFERFYRVDKSRARESGGTGLGLSIAKHLIERQGGRIQAKSGPGKGSTFTITLARS